MHQCQFNITTTPAGIIVSAPYSEANCHEFRARGGKFVHGSGWIFPQTSATRAMIERLFGAESELVTVRVKVDHSKITGGDCLMLGGYVLAPRRGNTLNVVVRRAFAEREGLEIVPSASAPADLAPTLERILVLLNTLAPSMNLMHPFEAVIESPSPGSPSQLTIRFPQGVGSISCVLEEVSSDAKTHCVSFSVFHNEDDDEFTSGVIRSPWPTNDAFVASVLVLLLHNPQCLPAVLREMGGEVEDFVPVNP